MNVVSSVLLTFLSLYIYNTFYEAADKLPADTLGYAILSVLGVTILSISLFLLSIKRSYLPSFFSLETAPAFCTRQFLEAATDEARAAIFVFNPQFYEAIREEIKTWLAVNWNKVLAKEQPWFDEKLRSLIPEDLIPEQGLWLVKIEKKEREDEAIHQYNQTYWCCRLFHTVVFT